MLIGAAGISIGLLLFGAKLIRTVGKQLTTLDQSRAFCVCLSAAITVIGASALGLPVSSTHIAIGAVFGIGFLREFKCNTNRFSKRTHIVELERKSNKALRDDRSTPATEPARKPRKLVRRWQLISIAAAWFVTVPSAAGISAVLFFLAQGLAG